MSIIQRIESGYLQLLRIALLLMATLAIVAVGVFGFQYLSERNATAKPVSESVTLDLSAYNRSTASSTPPNEQTQSPVSTTTDPLEEQVGVSIGNLGRAGNSGFTANRQGVHELFAGIENDSALGRPFIELLVKQLIAAQTNKQIISRIAINPGPEIVNLINYLATQYKQKKASVSEQKDRENAEAATRRAEAAQALYVAGILALVFSGLVLLVVLLRIERNLRGAFTPAK